jgi:hypothetical protein
MRNLVNVFFGRLNNYKLNVLLKETAIFIYKNDDQLIHCLLIIAIILLFSLNLYLLKILNSFNL